MARRWNGALAVRTLLPVLSLPEPVFRDEQVPYEERKIPLDSNIPASSSHEIIQTCAIYEPNITREHTFSNIPDYDLPIKRRKEIFTSRRSYFHKSGRR